MQPVEERSRSGRSSVVLRGWQERGRWWFGMAGAPALVAGGLVLLRSVIAESESTSDVAVPGILLMIAGVGLAAMLLRHRVRVDERGIAVRWFRTERHPWDEIAELRVLRAGRRGLPTVIVVRGSGAAAAVAYPRHPDPFLIAAEAARPVDVAPARRADPPARQPPMPVMVVGSPWRWAPVTAVLLPIMVLAVASMPFLLSNGWANSLATVFLFAILTAFAVLDLRAFHDARTVIRADAVSFAFRDRTTRRVPMRSVERFVAVTAWGEKTTAGIGVLHDGGGWLVPMPPGRQEVRADQLVARLEALRLATAGSGQASTESDADPIALADREVSGTTARSTTGGEPFDPMFAPPTVPRGPIRWALPAALGLLAVAMLVSLPFSAAAERREVDALQARGVDTAGIVVGVNTETKKTRGQLRYDTDAGPLTIEVPINPDEVDGSRPIALRYDPLEPTYAWRASESPVITSAWVTTLFLLAVPFGLALALWLRWHPPKVDLDEIAPPLVV